MGNNVQKGGMKNGQHKKSYDMEINTFVTKILYDRKEDIYEKRLEKQEY